MCLISSVYSKLSTVRFTMLSNFLEFKFKIHVFFFHFLLFKGGNFNFISLFLLYIHIYLQVDAYSLSYRLYPNYDTTLSSKLANSIVVAIKKNLNPFVNLVSKEMCIAIVHKYFNIYILRSLNNTFKTRVEFYLIYYRRYELLA